MGEGWSRHFKHSSFPIHCRLIRNVDIESVVYNDFDIGGIWRASDPGAAINSHFSCK